MVDGLLFLLLASLAFVTSSAVHEAGHIVAGLAQGFRFHWFVAGPLGLKRDDNGKVRFYLERNVSLWGGLGATVPQDSSPDNYRKFALVLLGGPLMSVAVGAICLALAGASGLMFVTLVGAMSLGMGLVSLMPTRNGAFYTDGGRWLRMHRSGVHRQEELALWNLTQSAIITGTHELASLDEIKVLTDSVGARTRYLGHYYAFCHFKDSGDTGARDEARTRLVELSRQVPRQMVAMFRVD